MCHADHPHTLTSPVTATHENNVYLDATTQATRASGSATRIGSGAGQNRARTDFDSTLNTGLCASCHQKPIVANGITVGPANFGASAHDFASNTVGATSYSWSYALHDASTFGRNCTKCHASRVEGNTPAVASGAVITAVHYSDTDPNLLAGTTNPAGSAANFICYNCHGTTATPAAGAQGNRSGKVIQSQIAKGTAPSSTAGSGHPANSDAVHSSATESANAVFGNTLGVGGRHAACLDCHDPHEAKPTSGNARVTGSPTSGNVSGPALQGAWGAQLSSNPAFWTAPASGNFTRKTLVAGTDPQATLCFKCHTGYYWGATGAPPLSPSLALTYASGTATAALNGTAVTGTGTAWGAQHIGWTIRNNTVGVTHTITAVTSATSLTISPAATLAWTGAYTMQTGPSYSYSTGTAVTATLSGTPPSTSTINGTGTSWTTLAGAMIKNNTLGVWHNITAVASATSLTISPPTTTAWTGAYTIQTLPETDVAKEFNPANVGNYATTGTTSWQTGETAGSFHPVLASAGSNLGATSNIKAPWTRTSLMTCSDCHDSDTTTDPNGPHGSAAKFILKGPNTLWNSTLTTASTGMPASTFCINCHNQDFTGSRFNPGNQLSDGHVKSNHQRACFNCHSAIPHGAPRPGLLNAAAGVATAVPAMVPGYDGTPPYYQGGTTNRLYLKSYPATNTTNWEQANCGCNGTGH